MRTLPVVTIALLLTILAAGCTHQPVDDSCDAHINEITTTLNGAYGQCLDGSPLFLVDCALPRDGRILIFLPKSNITTASAVDFDCTNANSTLRCTGVLPNTAPAGPLDKYAIVAFFNNTPRASYSGRDVFRLQVLNLSCDPLAGRLID